MTEWQELAKNIGKIPGLIFRHLVPGILVLGAIGIVRREYFVSVNFGSAEWLIFLSVIAVAIGNVWFVVHRYVVQQFFDYLFWRRDLSGSPTKTGDGYCADVARHTWNNLSSKKASSEFKDHLGFRTSSVVLLYIVAEVILVFTPFAREPSFIAAYRPWILAFGSTLFIFAVMQNFLTRHLENLVSA